MESAECSIIYSKNSNDWEVLTQMEVGQERKDYLFSLSVEDRTALLPYLTDEQLRELMSSLTIEDHVCRLSLLPLKAAPHYSITRLLLDHFLDYC